MDILKIYLYFMKNMIKDLVKSFLCNIVKMTKNSLLNKSNLEIKKFLNLK